MTAVFKPVLGALADADEAEHDRNLDEDADDGGKGGTGGEAEEHHGGGNGYFEVVGSSDHGGGSGVLVGELEEFGSDVAEGEDGQRL